MVEPDPIPLAPRATPLTGTIEESWPVGDWSEGGGGGGHDGSKDFGFFTVGAGIGPFLDTPFFQSQDGLNLNCTSPQ